MRISTSLRWLVVALSAAMLLAVAAACSSETIEVPGETVVVEKEVVKTVEVPGETVTVEVVKEVQVPGETVVVEKEVIKTVEVPGETVVVKEEVIKTVEVPGQTVVVEKEVVKEVEAERYVRNVRGELVEKPQYGGTMSVTNSGAGGNQTDPWYGVNEALVNLVLEHPGIQNWAVPPEEFNSQTKFFGMDYMQGNLVESWEQPDLNTYVFHIREGVHWHDKAPMNGREFNAYDFEFTYHRQLGFPEKHGFTEASSLSRLDRLPIESVTASDEWTLELKPESTEGGRRVSVLKRQEGVPVNLG